MTTPSSRMNSFSIKTSPLSTAPQTSTTQEPISSEVTIGTEITGTNPSEAPSTTVTESYTVYLATSTLLTSSGTCHLDENGKLVFVDSSGNVEGTYDRQNGYIPSVTATIVPSETPGWLPTTTIVPSETPGWLPTPDPSISNSPDKPKYQWDFSTTQKGDEWAERWFNNNFGISRVENNFNKYKRYFESAGEKYGIDWRLLAAICSKESTMGVGSSNIMQMTNPGKRQEYGCILGNIDSMISSSAHLLSDLLKRSGGDVAKALVGYNCGEYSKSFTKYNPNTVYNYANYVLALYKCFCSRF